MNKKKLAELRSKMAAAAKRMDEKFTALRDANPDDDNVDIDALQTSFDEAKEEHRSAKSAYDDGKMVLEARENAPVDNTDPADDPDPTVEVRSEPATYQRGSRRSYFLDLVRDKQGDPEARDRLDRHAKETRDSAERQEKLAEARFNAGLDRALGELRLPDEIATELRSHLVEKRAINRTDGTGGDFVPPSYLMDLYAEVPRGGRPFADACRGIPLPEGTDSINVPRIATGTATAPQTADNANVQSTDLTTATVTAPVRTIAGQQDLPLQLIDQSPLAFDEIVFADLMADLAYQTEAQCINGSGSSGQLLGLLGVSGIATVTYTDASPTLPEAYPKIAGALSAARTARKRPITHGWASPARMYWASSQLDSASRPFVTPQVAGPMNALAVRDQEAVGQAGDEDFVLNMLVPHRMTDAVPTNLGGGVNEDRLIYTRMFDHLLFEGALRARAMTEVLSGSMGVRLQVYRYVAFTGARFPSATAVVAGTGLATPTF